jgi:hypothetical protein
MSEERNAMKCAVVGCERNALDYKFSGQLELKICQEHIYDFTAHSKRRLGALVEEQEKAGLLGGYLDGYVYVIRLSSGTVKIGYTGSSDLRRLKVLTNQRNKGMPVVVLGVLKGGKDLEAQLHYRWKSLRVAGKSEEFHPTPELLDWAESVGITPEVDIEGYDEWMEKGHKRKRMGGFVEQIWNDVTASARVNVQDIEWE